MKPFNNTTIRRLTSRLEQEDDFVFLESSRLSEENHRSFLFRNPSAHLCCQPGDSITEFLEQVDQARTQGQYLAGWLAYEFGYLLEPCLRRFLPQASIVDKPLAMLGVYEAPLIFDHKTEKFNNKTDWPLSSYAENQEASYTCTELATTISRQDYIQAIHAIQDYIRAGDTYQVNFTLHFDFQFQGSVAALYRALRRNQSVAYSAWIRHQGQDVLSFSPELFFAADAEKVRVRPMKGTMSRGRTNTEDAAQQEALRTDPKNQSENVMIVDLLRNDLGRLLYSDDQEKTQGRVLPKSLFDVEIYESLLQMTSTIDGVLEQQGEQTENHAPLSFQRLIRALFPCGSVTGAPKIRTMEIIRELEEQPRGVYCGAIGYAGPEQSCFNVPIRTVELSKTLNKTEGRMGIGSGIVADSVAEAEWEECLIKGNFLTKNAPDFQLIETLLWQPEEEYFLLDYHLERLWDSAHYFHFVCDKKEVITRLEQGAAELRKGEPRKDGSTKYRVRLLLYRDGRVEISSTPLPASSPQGPAKVIFSQEQVDARDPHRFHKTTRRELYTQEFQRANAQGCYDVLFTNTVGEITEGAITNIFIRPQKGEPLLTPPVQCGLLAGTYRRMLLEQDKAIEQVLRREDFLKAEQVYVANSVRGLVPVCLQQSPEDKPSR
ncbi:MAG: chorismate-binding protein [Candidatus Electrothrix aestuarii]|uniref:Chorismate-binding protein n=1 Tax=Candidatus Electrothrix aestuarii TaxID=3062594 RepID=A0AAU8LU58_9BACT|nr:chorismate-binding protein [Candidatus Electrothrix aestuarii]